ncbi:MAG: hypothetical protein PUC41_03535 [Oscillospiraceae bacterium]|nr:hypothetical protein [Oscillospiraceae bacterium]
MLRITNLKLPLSYTPEMLCQAAAHALKVAPDQLHTVTLARRAVDARKEVCFIATADVTLDGEKRILAALQRKGKGKNITEIQPYHIPRYPQYTRRMRPVIVGCGPAGLFAAYVLAQAGAAPILLERGKSVQDRMAALETYHQTGVLDPECNLQFGEGGAGTFSDGKLNTGTKDPRIRQVLHIFTEYGAPDEILWQAKPHIGTDQLAVCIPALRKKIEALGGEVRFGAKCTAIHEEKGILHGITYMQNGIIHQLQTDAVILAVGHSAREVFTTLHGMGLPMEQKAFSLGVRIEHLQTDIDRFCYGKAAGHPALGAASYKLAVHLPNGRGVYSFCMCPGGTVQAAASEPNTVVTNGMSRFARDERNANSALLVGITPADFEGDSPLAGMALQRRIEQAAYRAGGETGAAPVILAEDFVQRKVSTGFGKVLPSYPLGTRFAALEDTLPSFVCDALRDALPLLDRQLRGFYQPDAVLTAPETRSSSPVRLLRDPHTLQSVGLKGLYPCGEGAGYAGGIVSAAVDGIKCAEQLLSLC